MLHTKFKQINRYYYRCEVTKLLYFVISQNKTTIKFKCASGLGKDIICTKYKKDIIKG